MEQHSHPPSTMPSTLASVSRSATPDALSEQLQQRELARALRFFTRARLTFVPIAAVFMTLVVVFDPAAWKVWALSIVVAVMIGITVLDALRSDRRDSDLLRMALRDLGIGLVVQTALIALTGAVESPLLVIYVPLALISGIALGPGRQRWVLLAAISTLLWAMTVGGLCGWRTTPAFLQLGDGFAGRPIYALTTAGVVQLAVVIASTIGVTLRRGIARALADAASARQQVLDGLADRNRELVHLSSAIAHELKNPLASIKGLVQLLRRGGKNSEARFDMLQREIDRMRDTLDEFLNFSRPIGDLNIEQVELAPLIAELDALHEGVADAHDVTIVAPPDADDAPPVRGDVRKIKQALSNLLHNAIEASPRGGCVRWRVERDGDSVRIALCDEGPGLHASVRTRASEAGVTTKPDGSGIGLAVARSIAEQHGGALELRDAVDGGGCEASLSLPCGEVTP